MLSVSAPETHCRPAATANTEQCHSQDLAGSSNARSVVGRVRKGLWKKNRRRVCHCSGGSFPPEGNPLDGCSSERCYLQRKPGQQLTQNCTTACQVHKPKGSMRPGSDSQSFPREHSPGTVESLSLRGLGVSGIIYLVGCLGDGHLRGQNM